MVQSGFGLRHHLDSAPNVRIMNRTSIHPCRYRICCCYPCNAFFLKDYACNLLWARTEANIEREILLTPDHIGQFRALQQEHAPRAARKKSIRKATQSKRSVKLENIKQHLNDEILPQSLHITSVDDRLFASCAKYTPDYVRPS
jgi:hypothetical protein